MGLAHSAPASKKNKVRKKEIKPPDGLERINYDEPVYNCLCFYFFPKRKKHESKTELEEVVAQENVAETDPEREAKALKFARILFFQDDFMKAEKKKEADCKALELERSGVPIHFRMYDWGNPAPLEFTNRVMRQEARIALCMVLQNFDK